MNKFESLTESQIRDRLATDKAAKVRLGYGLYVERGKTSDGSYRFNFKLAGLPASTYTFGKVGEFPADRLLDELVRVKADVDAGRDPRKMQRAAKAATGNSFREAAEAWLSWRSQAKRVTEDYNEQVTRRLKADVYPYLGDLALDAILPSDVFDVCERVQNRGALDTAVDLAAHIKGIFRRAKLKGKFAGINPAEDTVRDLDKPESECHDAVLSEDLPRFLADLRARKWKHVETLIGLKLMVHWAIRTTVLREIRWDWVDFDNALVTVPPHCKGLKQKTKGARQNGDYLIPLSRQATEILRELHARTSATDYLFPGRGDVETVSSGTWLGALKDMGWNGELSKNDPEYRPNATVHGFRSTFLNFVEDENALYEKAADLQLDHAVAVGNKVKRAYRRDRKKGHRELLLDQRRDLMQWWSDRIDRAAAEPVVAVARPTRNANRTAGEIALGRAPAPESNDPRQST